MESSKSQTNRNDGVDVEETTASFGRQRLKDAVDLRQFMKNGSMEFELNTDSQTENMCNLRDTYNMDFESDEDYDIPRPENNTEGWYASSQEMQEDSDASSLSEEEPQPQPDPAAKQFTLPYFNNIALLKAQLKEKQEQRQRQFIRNKPKRKVKPKQHGGLFAPWAAEGKVPITNDGQLLKVIRHHGNGIKPPVGSRVWIKYIVFKEDDRERSEQTAIDFAHQNVPYVFTLFNHDVVPALEYGVASMEVNEHAEFLASSKYAYGSLGIPKVIDPHTNCIFVVELIKFMDNAMVDLAKMDAAEQEAFPFDRVKEAALSHKTSGNLRHKEGKWESALQQYRKGVLVLERHLTADKLDDDERNELLFVLFNNMAQTYLEMENGRQALSYVAKAEELPTETVGNRSKLMFRKCKAYMLLNKLDNALNACLKAKELEPGNPAPQKCFDKITELIGAEKAASSKIFDKMAKAYFSTPSKV